jgi:hypothetical protein
MNDSRQDDADNQSKVAGKVVGALLKKAVSLGAGAYVTAEDTVSKTLGAAQIPKEMIRDALENFFETYTISINAEVKFTPKKKDKKDESGT